MTNEAAQPFYILLSFKKVLVAMKCS